jgi:hypothetical protein
MRKNILVVENNNNNNYSGHYYGLGSVGFEFRWA